MQNHTLERLNTLARTIGIKADNEEHGINYLWTFIEAIRNDESVFIIKVDGERTAPKDGGSYTVFVTGKRLEGEPCRADGSDIDEVVAEAILIYARIAW